MLDWYAKTKAAKFRTKFEQSFADFARRSEYVVVVEETAEKMSASLSARASEGWKVESFAATARGKDEALALVAVMRRMRDA